MWKESCSVKTIGKSLAAEWIICPVIEFLFSYSCIYFILIKIYSEILKQYISAICIFKKYIFNFKRFFYLDNLM